MSETSKVRVVGIDLGTTNSEIYKMEHGHAVPCVGPNGIRITPSRVVVDPNSESDKPVFLVDAKAKNLVKRVPQNEIYEPKRIIGRKYEDPCVSVYKYFWPFSIIEDDDGGAVYSVKGKEGSCKVTPVDVDAQILRTMKKYVKEGVDKAVITVPAVFSEKQKEATRKAGEDAGFEVIRIIPEPAAAAIAYGRKKDVKNKVIMVYDLGGGTFDCCVLRVTGSKYKILAYNGDSHLGGADFDNAIVRFVCQKYKEQYNIDLYEDKYKSDFNALKAEAEKTKKGLSDVNNPTFKLRFTPKSKNSKGEALQEYTYDFTRVEFEGLIQKSVNTTIMIVEKMINDLKGAASGVKGIDDIDDIVCVGGSTRIPLVRQSLEEFFGRMIDFNAVNIDEAVAEGAAIYADCFMDGVDLLEDSLQDSVKQDVVDPFPQPNPIPYVAKNIYYNCGYGLCGLYKRGQQFGPNKDHIPTSRNITPLYDNVKFVKVDLFCSDDDDSPKEFIGRCRLEISEPSPKDRNKIRMKVKYSIRGELECVVRDINGDSESSYKCICRDDYLDDFRQQEAFQRFYELEIIAREQLRQTYKQGDNNNSDENVEKREKIFEFMEVLKDFESYMSFDMKDLKDLKEQYEEYFGSF